MGRSRQRESKLETGGARLWLGNEWGAALLQGDAAAGGELRRRKVVRAARQHKTVARPHFSLSLIGPPLLGERQVGRTFTW